MLVPGLQMPAADVVVHQVQLVQLGDGDSQGLVDLVQTPDAGLLGCLGHPEQEIGPIRVFYAIRASLRIPNEMRHEMEVPYRPEKLDNWTKIAVGIDLLEMRLGHSFRIDLVIRAWSCEQFLTLARDDLLLEDRPVKPPRLCRERDFVRPSCWVGFIANRDPQRDATVIEIPCRQAPDARHPAPARYGVLEAPAR